MAVFPSSRRVVAGVNLVTPSDSIIECDSTDGVVELILPSVEAVVGFISRQGGSVGGLVQFPLTIVDAVGNASVNNIIITPNPSSSDVFSGITSPNIVININGGSAKISPVADGIWGAGLSGGGGANPIVSQRKSLIMKLSQALTAEPKSDYTAQNDFGATPVFTYISAGKYQMTLVGAFPDSTKVFFFQRQIGKSIDVGGGKLVNSFVDFEVVDADTLNITTYQNNSISANSLMTAHDVEIVVFP